MKRVKLVNKADTKICFLYMRASEKLNIRMLSWPHLLYLNKMPFHEGFDVPLTKR